MIASAKFYFNIAILKDSRLANRFATRTTSEAARNFLFRGILKYFKIKQNKFKRQPKQPNKRIQIQIHPAWYISTHGFTHTRNRIRSRTHMRIPLGSPVTDWLTDWLSDECVALLSHLWNRPLVVWIVFEVKSMRMRQNGTEQNMGHAHVCSQS